MAIMIALDTGLRLEGIIGLEWGHIRDGVVRRVVKRKKEVEIPLTDRLKVELPAYQAAMEVPSLNWVFPSPEDPSKHRHQNFHETFQAACSRAGIFVTKADGTKKNFRFHDLLHTFATKALRRGINVKAVQLLLGHSSLTMTQKYAHVDLNDLKAAMKLFDERRETTED